MKQPDRLVRLVRGKQMVWLSGHVSSTITAKDAIALLRRERARLKRKVKGLPTVETTDFRKKILSVWIKLDDVLNLLEE